jgi:hypothetical protein
VDGAVAGLVFLIVNRSRQRAPNLSASDRTECRTRPCGCGNEATESSLGLPRIAQQIALAFNLPFDKDVVRRILAHYLPEPASGGPSWLTDSPSLMNDFPPLASCCGQADKAPDSSLRTLVNARNAVRCQGRLRLPRRLGPGFEMIQKLAALGIVS